VKADQRRSDEDKNRAYVEPERERLRKEQIAQGEEIPEQAHDLEITHGVGFQQLQGDEQEQNAQAWLHAQRGAVGDRDAAHAEAKKQNLERQGR
jgi:hypothetical protein